MGKKKTYYTKLFYLVKASQTPMLPNKEINHVFVCKDLSIFDFGRSPRDHNYRRLHEKVVLRPAYNAVVGGGNICELRPQK